MIDAGYTKDESEKVTIVQHGRGCSTCNNTGYKGRVGLYEVMEINDDLRELILVGRFGAGTQEEGAGNGNDYAAAQRIDQMRRWGTPHSKKSLRETVL